MPHTEHQMFYSEHKKKRIKKVSQMKLMFFLQEYFTAFFEHSVRYSTPPPPLRCHHNNQSKQGRKQNQLNQPNKSKPNLRKFQQKMLICA